MIGWKEYELEVMRDRADNFVVICSIENFDPMGIHTGDSVTVAPAQTLTDREYQVHAQRGARHHPRGRRGDRWLEHPVRGRPEDRAAHRHRDEPPRLPLARPWPARPPASRSRKIAALLAIGYHLDEIRNDITQVTPASFEPVIDYVVVKIPRWAFEKFPTPSPPSAPR